jgi:hypothetical protein
MFVLLMERSPIWDFRVLGVNVCEKKKKNNDLGVNLGFLA